MGTITCLNFFFRIKISIRNEIEIHTVVNSRIKVEFIASHVHAFSCRTDVKLKRILGFVSVNLQLKLKLVE